MQKHTHDYDSVFKTLKLKHKTKTSNTIITHITNGNENEERLVNIMGGTVFELPSEILLRQGMEQGRIEMVIQLGRKDGLSDAVILDRLQDYTDLSLEEAKDCLKKYRKL